MKHILITTPCCNHEQKTKASIGDLARCSKCKNPFIVRKDMT